MKTNSTLSYLLSDELGSSTIALDSTGNTQAVQLFAPYGAVRYSQGTMPTTYNFTGQRLNQRKNTREAHLLTGEQYPTRLLSLSVDYHSISSTTPTPST